MAQQEAGWFRTFRKGAHPLGRVTLSFEVDKVLHKLLVHVIGARDLQVGEQLTTTAVHLRVQLLPNDDVGKVKQVGDMISTAQNYLLFTPRALVNSKQLTLQASDCLLRRPGSFIPDHSFQLTLSLVSSCCSRCSSPRCTPHHSRS